MEVIMSCKCVVKSARQCQNVPGHANCVIGTAEARCYHRDGDPVIRPIRGYKPPNEEDWI